MSDISSSLERARFNRCIEDLTAQLTNRKERGLGIRYGLVSATSAGPPPTVTVGGRVMRYIDTGAGTPTVGEPVVVFQDEPAAVALGAITGAGACPVPTLIGTAAEVVGDNFAMHVGINIAQTEFLRWDNTADPRDIERWNLASDSYITDHTTGITPLAFNDVHAWHGPGDIIWHFHRRQGTDIRVYKNNVLMSTTPYSVCDNLATAWGHSETGNYWVIGSYDPFLAGGPAARMVEERDGASGAIVNTYNMGTTTMGNAINACSHSDGGMWWQQQGRLNYAGPAGTDELTLGGSTIYVEPDGTIHHSNGRKYNMSGGAITDVGSACPEVLIGGSRLRSPRPQPGYTECIVHTLTGGTHYWYSMPIQTV